MKDEGGKVLAFKEVVFGNQSNTAWRRFSVLLGSGAGELSLQPQRVSQSSTVVQTGRRKSKK